MSPPMSRFISSRPEDDEEIKMIARYWRKADKTLDQINQAVYSFASKNTRIQKACSCSGCVRQARTA